MFICTERQVYTSHTTALVALKETSLSMKLDPTLKIYPTPMHPCPYMPGLIARNAVVDPEYIMTLSTYDYLVQNGFRRSGDQVYRPYCHTCEKCVTTRIPVRDFARSRSQKRIWRRNQDLTVKINDSGFKQAYLPIYQRYLESRHDSLDYEEVERFLTADWCDIVFYEFYQPVSPDTQTPDNQNPNAHSAAVEGGAFANDNDTCESANASKANEELIGIAVTDKLPSGLSAVYTFFEPEQGSKRSLGVYALMWQIEAALAMEMDYVYPGFWIKDCRKMSYKSNYQPIQGLIKGQWVNLEKGNP